MGARTTPCRAQVLVPLARIRTRGVELRNEGAYGITVPAAFAKWEAKVDAWSEEARSSGNSGLTRPRCSRRSPMGLPAACASLGILGWTLAIRGAVLGCRGHELLKFERAGDTKRADGSPGKQGEHWSGSLGDPAGSSASLNCFRRRELMRTMKTVLREVAERVCVQLFESAARATDPMTSTCVRESDSAAGRAPKALCRADPSVVRNLPGGKTATVEIGGG